MPPRDDWQGRVQIRDFLEMGGYAAFIWPAFTLTALIMLGLAVSSLRDLRAQQKTLRDLEAEAPGRRRRAATKEDRP